MRICGHNIWAILTATILGFVLAFTWYSPALFGNAWLASMGTTMEVAESMSMGLPVAISFITTLIACITFSWLLKRLDISGFVKGMGLGALIAVAFIITSYAMTFAWSPTLNWCLFSIDTGYRLVYSILACGILGAWR